MKRWVVAALVAGVVLAALVVPAAGQTTTTAPPTTLSLDPASGPGGTTGTWTIAVSGSRWFANQNVTITFAGANVTPSPPPRSDAAGSWATVITVTRRPAGSYTVNASQQVCTNACFLRSVDATFTSYPTLALSPTCHQAGQPQTLTVTGNGFPPNSGTIGVSYDGGAAKSVEPNPDSTFTTTFDVVPPGRDVPVVAQQIRTKATARATWSPCPPDTTTTSSTTIPGTVPSSTTTSTRSGGSTSTTSTTIPTIVTIPPPTPGATLAVDPPIGPGGFVTKARGTGFPANQPVNLGWSPGIGIFAATAGADGTFETPVLVMRRDVLGTRTIVATAAGGAVSASTSFLVVPATVHPSGKDVAQITRVRRFLNR